MNDNNMNNLNDINSNLNNNSINNQNTNLNPNIVNNNQTWANAVNQNVNTNLINSNSGQNINVAENFLNVIKENTNDDVMINNIETSNFNSGNNEVVSDTFNMNNIDPSQIVNNTQPELNNINQIQELNQQNINNVDANNNIINNPQPNTNNNVNNLVTDNQNMINNYQSNINNGVADTFANNTNSLNNSVTPNGVVDNFANSNEINNQVNTQNNNINNQVNNNDEELLRIYVGEKYDKIKNSSFSLPTFFLGTLYLFYRKMYLYGWLMMLLGPLAFIGYIILAIKFKDVYINFCNKKINKLKAKNSNASYDELKNICSKKGGTSIGMVILNTFILFLIIFVVLIIMIIPMIFLTLGSGDIEIKPSINNGEVILDEEFDSTDDNQALFISYDLSINTDEVFSIVVPDGFTKESDGIDYSYSSDPEDYFGSCEFSLNAVTGHSNADEFIKYLKGWRYNDDSELTTNTINNINWISFTYDFMGNNYNYITEKDGIIYLFEYEEGNDSTDLDFCKNNFQPILNSIKFK